MLESKRSILRFFALLLLLLLATDARSVAIDGLEYQLGPGAAGPGGYATVTGRAADSNDLAIIIPATVFYQGGEYEVLEVRGFQGVGITSVVLPEGLILIDQSAFENNSLSSVALPSSVELVFDGAFWGNRLSSVSIPRGTSEIMSFAFYDNHLESVILPDTLSVLGNNTFGRNSLRSVTFRGDYPFGDNFSGDLSAFNENPTLESVYVCENAEGWEARSFYNGALTIPVTPTLSACDEDGDGIPDKLDVGVLKYRISGSEATVLGWATGFDWDDYYNLIVPATIEYEGNIFQVTGIGEAAFLHSAWFANVSLPEGITSIGKNAFDSSFSAVNQGIVLPNSLRVIDDLALQGNSLTSVELPEGLVVIGAGAFNFNKLETIVMPSTLEILGSGAIARNALQQVDFLGQYTNEISSNAFGSNGEFDAIFTDDVTCSWDGVSFGSSTQPIVVQNSNPHCDSDGDGVKNQDDGFPLDPNASGDDDGDGVDNLFDAFPNDPEESIDSDGDGVGDNSDAFPYNADESTDTDGDLIGDNEDTHPLDPTLPKGSVEVVVEEIGQNLVIQSTGRLFLSPLKFVTRVEEAAGIYFSNNTPYAGIFTMTSVISGIGRTDVYCAENGISEIGEAEFNLDIEQVGLRAGPIFGVYSSQLFASPGIFGGEPVCPSPFALSVPAEYVSGEPMYSFAVVPARSLASLGLIQGVYTWEAGGQVASLTIRAAGDGRPKMPSQPIVITTDYADGTISLRVTLVDDGGSSITRYDASCTDGVNTFTGTSPTPRVEVSGLTNGTAYTCTASATNAVGTSGASAATDSITPEALSSGLPIWLLYEATQ